MIKRFFVCLFCLLSAITGSVPTLAVASADEASNAYTFDTSPVLSDLYSATIKGKEFSPGDYEYDADKDIELLAFAERSYNHDTSVQDDYALYLYVYNPSGVSIPNSEQNMVSMSIGEGSYEKYSLSLCNYSPEPYEMLYYKYRIDLQGDKKQSILNAIDPNERVYNISGVELVNENNNPIEYKVGERYVYTGFSEGYGEIATENTLKCEVYSQDTLFLEPQFTSYRPEGNNGVDKYTQDSLHSVYFAIPNDVLEAYGEINAIRATWLDAVLNPFIVTENIALYDYTVANYLNTKKLGDYKYRFFGDPMFYTSVFETSMSYGYYWGNNTDNLSYIYMDVYHDNVKYPTSYYSKNFKPINFMVLTGDIENDIISSEEIQNKVLETSASLNDDELVLDKYASSIFQSVAKKFTTLEIKATDEKSLDKYVCDQTWWEKLFGIDSYYNDALNHIKSIEPVTNFSGTNEHIAERYFISPGDADKFVEYCNAATENDSTVYVLRYQISDYKAQDLLTCTVEYNSSELIGGYRYKNTYTAGWDSYVVMRETVNLGFDIIEVSFMSEDAKETVLPINMSPVDVFPNVTAPLEDKNESWLVYLLIAIAVGLVLVLFIFLMIRYPIFRKIVFGFFKGVGIVISWPVLLAILIVQKVREKQ